MAAKPENTCSQTLKKHHPSRALVAVQGYQPKTHAETQNEARKPSKQINIMLREQIYSLLDLLQETIAYILGSST